MTISLKVCEIILSKELTWEVASEKCGLQLQQKEKARVEV